MFNVRAIDHGGFQAIVTALSYESSLDDLQYIEQVLRELFGSDRHASVIWDLLCTNGLSWNRFLSASFDGRRFDLSSFKALPESEVDEKIIHDQKVFFRESGALENSVLSKEQIKSILG